MRRKQRTDPELPAEFMDDVRDGVQAPVDDAVKARHLTAMAEAASLMPVRALRRPASLRRKPVLSTLFGSLAAKVAAGAAVALVGTGTAAANGALPAPAQQAVSTVAEKIGFDFPAGPEVQSVVDENGRQTEQPEVDSDDNRGGSDRSHEVRRDDDVREVKENTDATGRDFGHEVADAASDGRRGSNSGSSNGDDDKVHDKRGPGSSKPNSNRGPGGGGRSNSSETPGARPTDDPNQATEPSPGS